MGLDVGVVTFEYLPEPQPPVHDFLYDLLLDPYTGIDEEYEDDDWGGSWDDNGMYEFSRSGLTSRAKIWAGDRSIGQSGENGLLNWIEALPWRNDIVSLHIGR